MVMAILNELSSTTKRLEKEAILTREKDNALLKRVVFLALDPFTQFYIRKIPAYKVNWTGTHITLDGLLPYLDELSTRLVTGNNAINHLTWMLENASPSDAAVIERIIQKDLKCGVSDSTANKIWPGLIHQYPCMLASQYDEKLVAKMKFPAMAQLKMDGMRFNAIVRSGKCELKSRSGKTVDLLGRLEQEFIVMAGGRNLVFDGELVVDNEGALLDRQTGNGILNKAVKGTISEQEAKRVRATLWDVIPYDRFVKGVDKESYMTRFTLLQSMSHPKTIRIVEHKVVANIEEAQAIFEKYLAEGQEGIILKNLNSPWEDKRSKNLIKFKGEMDCDLRVVGVQPGTGKYEGKLGALICESEDGVIKVDVGSGFKDFQREENYPIGTIVAVKYNARIKNKAGEESLFLPIFQEVRLDKMKADSSKDIK